MAKRKPTLPDYGTVQIKGNTYSELVSAMTRVIASLYTQRHERNSTKKLWRLINRLKTRTFVETLRQ